MATLHFEILRRIAETASGMRYQDTWFEVTDTDVLIYTTEPAPSQLQPDSTVIKCTAWKEPDIPQVTTATIATDTNSIDLLAVEVPEQELQGWAGPMTLPADAVFWSASAVEKFLIPYYASTYGSLAPKAVTQLMGIFVPPNSEEFKGNGMMELVDTEKPLVDVPLNEGTPTVAIAYPAGYDQPFAVVHLPSSEYLGDAGDPTGGGGAMDTGDPLPRLFTLHRSGAVKKLRVAV
ncbi:MAG TPA: hypothetical protein VM890_13650 [Longimicrobium sp.]|nr:hypothetical protein [Longimicrobium sp.]